MKDKRKSMNEYKRIEDLNDSRWTNSLKCDIFKNLTELEEFKKHARYTTIAATRQREKQNLHNLKKRKEKYNPLMKEAKSNFLNKIVEVSSNQKLLKRFKHLHANEIKSSIQRSIYRTTNETNNIIIEIQNKKKKLEQLQNVSYKKLNQNTSNENLKQKQMIGKIADIEKKISLVVFLNKKTEKIVESEKRNLQQYDLIYEQLINDLESTSASLVREVEIVESIRADIKNDDRKYKIEKKANENFMKKAYQKINKFNSITDSLEQCR